MNHWYLYLAIVSPIYLVAGDLCGDRWQMHDKELDTCCQKFIGDVQTCCNTQAKRSLALHTIAGGIGGALAYSIYCHGPVDSFNRARLLPLFSAELAGIIQPFIGPTIGLMVGGFAFYKIKRALVYPYKIKHEQTVAAFKKSLEDHKQEMYKQQSEHAQSVQNQLGILEDYVHKVHMELKQAEDHLTNAQEAVGDTQKTNAQLRATLQTLTPQVKATLDLTSQLSGQVAAESKLLRDYLAKKNKKTLGFFAKAH